MDDHFASVQFGRNDGKRFEARLEEIKGVAENRQTDCRDCKATIARLETEDRPVRGERPTPSAGFINDILGGEGDPDPIESMGQIDVIHPSKHDINVGLFTVGPGTAHQHLLMAHTILPDLERSL